MNAAIVEMKKKCRIKNATFEAIRSEHDKRKIIDYRYSFIPHDEMIADVKRFHAKARIVQNKSTIYRDEQFDLLPEDIEA